MFAVKRPNSKCAIIAEIGINHNGSVEIAKQLIDMAKKNSCDYVKFQKRDINVVYTQEVLSQTRESPWGTTQREQKMGLEFNQDQYKEIDRYCKEVGIGWFASAWDLGSQDFLEKFNCAHNKIASAMLTHWKFVERVASEKKHTFISTGMCGYPEVDRAVEIFEKQNCKYTLMHTVSTYPCAENETNVAVMLSLRERYKCPVGYSGHEAGVLPSMLAAALGADAIERHITLDRAMYGSDQAASLESRGLEILTKYIRAMEGAFGTGEKTFGDAEKAVAKKLRYFEA
ncbi:MAG: N-acetylneuraminate synthase family protein [Bdellovibrionota bacterium]